MTDLPASIFHLSLHVTSLEQSRTFYGDVLGCIEGRSTDQWVDFDFFGHQLSLHLGVPTATTATGEVDGVAVPMPHFGAVLSRDLWEQTAKRLQSANIDFIIKPQERYADRKGAQRTLFILDPSGNALEMKCMENDGELFE